MKRAKGRGWTIDDKLTGEVRDYITSEVGQYDARGPGFQATVFKRTSKGMNEYVCAFAGTTFNFSDIKADVLQPLGLSSQYRHAASVARKLESDIIKSGVSNFDLTFVGHSMGGGQAALASIVTGRKALTYNPAALTKSTMLSVGVMPKFHYPGITNYTAAHKILGIPFMTDMVGVAQRVISTGPKIGLHFNLTPPGKTVPVHMPFRVGEHSIDNMIKALAP